MKYWRPRCSKRWGSNTSKSFALIETGEELQRNDEPSPTRSAVLTRLSHGHIRIGTFQRLAFFEDPSRNRETGVLQPAPPVRRGQRRSGTAVRPGRRREPRPRRILSGRGLRPWRAQQRQYQHHRRKLRLWSVALRPDLGRAIRRGLFRSWRALCLRSPARGDPLGPGATRRLPGAGRRRAGVGGDA